MIPRIIFSDAWGAIEKKRKEYRHQLALRLALRASQAKHLLLQADRNGWKQWLPAHSEMIPPLGEDALITYALHAGEWFEQKHKNQWLRALSRMQSRDSSTNTAVESWLGEWEVVLDDMRRACAQALAASKEERVFQKLQEWEKTRESLLRARDELDALDAHRMRVQNEIASLTESEQAWETLPAFQEMKAQWEKTEQLQAARKGLEEEWKRRWDAVQPIIEIMANEQELLSRLEAAQGQVLQNYARNPWTARLRDPHALGLKWILQLALEEVHKNEWPLPSSQMAEYERRLEQAREEKFFEYFFWKNNELEADYQLQRRALDANPLYKEWVRALTEKEMKRQSFEALETQADVRNAEWMALEKDAQAEWKALRELVPREWKLRFPEWEDDGY